MTAAQAIYGLIKNRSANVTVIVDGLAASAASLIAMAEDRIIMPMNALMMIHNPMACISGDSCELLHAADALSKVKDTMISVYSAKTDKDSKSLSDMMDSETWMTAEEALKDGFIDEVDKNTYVNFFAKNGSGKGADSKSYRRGKREYIRGQFYEQCIRSCRTCTGQSTSNGTDVYSNGNNQSLLGPLGARLRCRFKV